MSIPKILLNQYFLQKETVGQELSNDIPGLFFVRHGHTTFNAGEESGTDLIRGWIDLDIDSEGIKQADALAVWASKEKPPIGWIESSPLMRAAHTADIISQRIGIPYVTSIYYMPWNMGNLQGKSANEAAQTMLDYGLNKPDIGVPETGEPFNRFLARAVDGVNHAWMRFLGQPGSGLVVTHYRLLKLIMSLHGDQFDVKEFLEYKPVPTIIKLLRKTPDGFNYGKQPPNAGSTGGTYNKK